MTAAVTMAGLLAGLAVGPTAGIATACDMEDYYGKHKEDGCGDRRAIFREGNP